ncbi:MAG: COG4315 family predicted lipoprotein [Acidimicrobiia bacterium]
MRRFLILLAAVAAGTVLAASCDDDGGGSSTTTDSGVTDLDESTGLDDTTGTGEPGAPPVEEGSATVSIGDNGYLVNAEGFTLYLFDNDMGTTSACTEGCASAWPPETAAGEPIGGEGVDGALLGTAEQADGSVQLTYNGHLLYRFSGDAMPGETNGNGVGGVWHAVDAEGNAAA